MTFTLRTNRLILKEVQQKDASFIFEIMNSEGWIQFIGDRGIQSLNDAEKYIINSIAKNYFDLGFGMYKVSLIETNQPIGLCGLVQRTYLKRPDLGFAILPSHGGKGYTYEASKSILRYANQKLGHSSILAITDQDNFACQKLLDKLGFVDQGIIHQNEENLMLYAYDYE